MVCTHSKSFIFSAFFSLSLLVSGLQASDYGRDVAKLVAPYVAAAVVAKVAENRLLGNGSLCPVGLIHEVVPVSTHSEERKVLMSTIPAGFPQPNDFTKDQEQDYQDAVTKWADKNGLKVSLSDTGEINHILKQEEVAVVDATVRRLGVQVGSIPVHVVSIPECKQFKKHPWVRRFMQAINTDVIVPGANIKNAFEIAAVLKVATMARPYLPAVPGFSKK
jgi:hypothetical protein